MTHSGPAAERTDRFAYDPPVVRHGAGAVGGLGAELERHGLSGALVVCGRSVGANPETMDPVRDGLGDRLVDVFAETTPEKRLSTAVAAAERLRSSAADCIVGLGGGSSLDVATLASLVAGACWGLGARSPEELADELVETGSITVPGGPLPPVLTVPTTLAGAALSGSAGVTVHPDGGLIDPADVDGSADRADAAESADAADSAEAADGGVSHPALAPLATVSDPAVVATTPPTVLRGSATNGLDKAVETLYARTATPVTDATAERALACFREGVPALAAATGDAPEDAEDVAPVVEGALLAQYGVVRADGSTLSVLHAFGHGLSRTSPLQQGVAHAVIAPHALAALFDEVDGRR
ncbi:MAG: iron-containing alcohol dehydrogenase [Halobacteriaceae archaeon]